MITEININVSGTFSNLTTKKTYKFESKELKNNIWEYTCKRKEHFSKNFYKKITLVGTSFIIGDSKSIYYNNSFIGNIKEVKGGFIPCSSIQNYHENKIYKTFENAKNQLINIRYSKIEKTSFGYLAQQKFYYTTNHLQNLSINQIANCINQFVNDITLSIRIVKKFLKSDIVDYYGQGGYKTRTKIVY